MRGGPIILGYRYIKGKFRANYAEDKTQQGWQDNNTVGKTDGRMVNLAG
jgi:hypothetical protein